MLITVPGVHRIRKVGNSLVVTIPADLAAQHDIKPDDLVTLMIQPVEQVTIPRLDPEVQRAVDRVLETDQAALRHLRGHAS